MRSPYMSDYPQCSRCVSSLSAPGNDCIAVVASCLQICLVSVTRGCWIEAPEKNPRSKLKFSNTENGDVCRCVCLWWFRNKFHISGCKCLCQCFSMFVHRRVCVCVYAQWGQTRTKQCSFLLFSDFGLAGLSASLWVSGLSRAIAPWQQPAAWRRQRVWPEREGWGTVGRKEEKGRKAAGQNEKMKEGQ